MRKLLIIPIIVLLIAMIGSQASAQDPAQDLGEINLLKIACNHASLTAGAAGLTIKNCRRFQPDSVEANQAVIVLRLVTNESGPYILTFFFHKSLWSVDNFNVVKVS